MWSGSPLKPSVHRYSNHPCWQCLFFFYSHISWHQSPSFSFYFFNPLHNRQIFSILCGFGAKGSRAANIFLIAHFMSFYISPSSPCLFSPLLNNEISVLTRGATSASKVVSRGGKKKNVGTEWKGKNECRKSSQQCHFSTHQNLLKGKKDISLASAEIFLIDLAKWKNKQQFAPPHFFLSFCFFSGLRFCSAVVMPRGMISTLPSALYWSEYSLGG